MKRAAKWGLWGFGLVVIMLAGSAYWLAPESIGRLQLTPSMVISLLATIFVVTLFVERAQEVILTNLRAYGSEALDLKLKALQAQLQRLERGTDTSAEVEDLLQTLADTRLEKLKYRAQTRIYALRMGVLMGVAVSLAGLRTLGALVPDTTLVGFAEVQQVIFHTVDIVITGGVIAGGSDGIHKMAELYRVSVESRSRAQQRKIDLMSN